MMTLKDAPDAHLATDLISFMVIHKHVPRLKHRTDIWKKNP